MGGFIVAFVGTALLCFITWVVVLTREENLGDFYDYAFGLGMLGWLAGFPLLGIATFRVKVLSRWCGVLLVGHPILIFSGLFTEFFGAFWILFGLLWLALAYALLSARSTVAEQPSRVR